MVPVDGNVFRARQTVDDLTTDLEDEDTGGQHDNDGHNKLAKTVREFGGYLTANVSAIPNYGERYRAGAIISTSFVESAVKLFNRMFTAQQYQPIRTPADFAAIADALNKAAVLIVFNGYSITQGCETLFCKARSYLAGFRGACWRNRGRSQCFANPFFPLLTRPSGSGSGGRRRAPRR